MPYVYVHDIAIASRPVARLIERGVHVINMWASGHITYNLILSILVLKYLHHPRSVGGQ